MAASQMVIFLKGCHQRDQLTLGATREKNAPCCGTCLHLAAGSRRSPGRWVRTCGAERSSELSVLLYTTNAGAAAPARLACTSCYSAAGAGAAAAYEYGGAAGAAAAPGAPHPRRPRAREAGAGLLWQKPRSLAGEMRSN